MANTVDQKALLKRIGGRIRARREELRMTQMDVAEQIPGLQRSTYGQYEIGYIDLPISRLAEVSAALGVKPTYFLVEANAEDVEMLAAIAAKVEELRGLLGGYRSSAAAE